MRWIFVLSFVVLTFLWLRWRRKNRRLLAMAEKIPGPPALPGLGNALAVMCQPEEFIKVIKQVIDDYGSVAKFWLGPDLNVIISDPDELKILLPNMKLSWKGPQYKYMANVLGGGILSGSGPTWRRHRKIATPNYGKRAIENYSPVFNDEVDLLLKEFRARGGTHMDFYEYVVRTTSYSVCRTLMGLTREQTLNIPNIEYLIDKTPRLYDLIFDRMTKWYYQIDPVFWLTNHYKHQKEFIVKSTEFSKSVIQHRLAHLKTLTEENKVNLMNLGNEDDNLKNTQLSVIDRFILSQDLDSDELIKETFTIFTSSQEASAKITSFTLLMLAYHQDCQNQVYAEIKSVMGDEDRPVTDEDFKQMPYLEQVFKEVLRLFPIGALIQRSVPEDIVMNSTTLPAGSSLVVPIYHIHRDSRFWSKPDDFDPDRFSAENVRTRHPYCYIPFSLGPMDCLGRYFGTKLVKTICVRVLREFKITTEGSYKDLKLAIAISVLSIDGFHAKLTPRAK